jgi:hypothetical protein
MAFPLPLAQYSYQLAMMTGDVSHYDKADQLLREFGEDIMKEEEQDGNTSLSVSIF